MKKGSISDQKLTGAGSQQKIKEEAIGGAGSRTRSLITPKICGPRHVEQASRPRDLARRLPQNKRWASERGRGASPRTCRQPRAAQHRSRDAGGVADGWVHVHVGRNIYSSRGGRAARPRQKYFPENFPEMSAKGLKNAFMSCPNFPKNFPDFSGTYSHFLWAIFIY
jgi:hypothetical protein